MGPSIFGVELPLEKTQDLLSSKSFLSWSADGSHSEPTEISAGRGRSFSYKGKKYTNLVVDEKHFSPSDLAKAWGVSVETVRQIFRQEPGVLRIGTNGDSRTRSYITLRIPQSVAARVHARLTALPQSR
jgi:hypothetical protein